MTENEIKIIEKISNLSGDYKCYDNKINREESLILDRLLTEIQAYRAIGTVEELKVLKEKNTPKKMVFTPKKFPCDYKCPNGCPQYDEYQVDFCPRCGQKLDWEGGE